MKITIENDWILVRGWMREKFRAQAQAITEVRVMADKATSRGLLRRSKTESKPSEYEFALRTVIIWTGDQAISLDDYYDTGVETAISWLRANGWDVDSASMKAIKTPFVRILVLKISSSA